MNKRGTRKRTLYMKIVTFHKSTYMQKAMYKKVVDIELDTRCLFFKI